MSLLFYEMKKMFIYKKGILLISIVIILEILNLIIIDTPRNPEIEVNYSQYNYYLDKLKGPHSDKVEQFFLDESKRMSDAKITLNKVYNDYYNGDILEQEFLSLSEPLEDILQNEVGFNLIFEQNMYVRENPINRYFIFTNGWDGLLSNESIDLLFFMLILVLVTPVFCAEFKSEMNLLHVTVKKGNKIHILTKICMVLVTVIVLSIVLSLIKYGFYQVKYGLENGHYPLQSLEYFSTSNKNITLLSAFIWISIFKTFGYMIFAVTIMFFSVVMKNYALTLFSSVSIIIPYLILTLESSKYFIPGPLGFMTATGFFKGDEYSYNIFTDQKVLEFEEVSLLSIFILLLINLAISCLVMRYIFKKQINNWSIKKNFNILSKFIKNMFILFFSTIILVGCSPNNIEVEEKRGGIFNYSTRESFENEDYKFSVSKTDLDGRKIIFENKKNGEVENLIRNPVQSFIDIKDSVYGNGDYVYYMQYGYKNSLFYKDVINFSIIEIDTSSFKEKVIFEKNLKSKDFSLIGSTNENELKNSYYFLSIESFFLDDKKIYLIGQDKISQVDRRTGEIKVIITSPNLVNVGFDGQNIYYTNKKNQIVRYNVKNEIENTMLDLITNYFLLTENELIFINRKDQYKIYTLNLDNFKTRKVTEESVVNFSYDNNFIYYESKNSLDSYRVDLN